MLKMRGVVCGAAAVAFMALPGSALASHGKAGLWETMVTPEGAPKGFSTKICMTQADVNNDKPQMPTQPNNPCKVTSSKVVGQTYSAETACSGQMVGTSHFEITYDKPEHYAGHSVFNGTVGGQKFSSNTKFEGKWLKADCGDVKPMTQPK